MSGVEREEAKRRGRERKERKEKKGGIGGKRENSACVCV